MEYTNILVAYDESDSAKNAVKTALRMIEDDPTANLSVINVSAPREIDDESFNFAAARAGVKELNSQDYVKIRREYMAADLDKLKEAISELAKGYENHVTCHVGQGKPAKAITDYAEKHDCDLIIMGCRGLNAVRGMLGSVSYAVLRSSKAPVLIVK